jgi:hypothetical protein
MRQGSPGPSGGHERARPRFRRRRLVPLAMALVLVGLLATALPAGATGLALGAYVQPAPTPGHPYAAIDTLDAGLGRHLAIYQTFQDWQTSAGVPQGFPVGFTTYVEGLGATPMVTWQPQDKPVRGQSPSSQPDFSLAQILTGRYDAFIKSWADQARGFGRGATGSMATRRPSTSRCGSTW